MKKLVSILIFLALPFVASAEVGDINIGGSVGIWDYEENENPDFSLNSLELVSIYSVLPHLDVQANLGFGIGDDSKIIDSGDEISLEISNYLSIYAKPKYDVMNYSFYGLLGYSFTRVEGSFNELSVKDSSDGLSFGAGVSISLSERSSFQTEWRQQTNPSAYELSGFTVGYIYRIN